jgi:hypothetical protein
VTIHLLLYSFKVFLTVKKTLQAMTYVINIERNRPKNQEITTM